MGIAISISTNISNNIRQLRETRRLTQDDLARLSGVPRATWANLESGSANPTILVLSKVATALQVPLEELVSPPREACRLYSAQELPTKRRGEATVRRILPDSVSGIDFERLDLPPLVRMGGIPHRTGTREYLTCETGSIELSVAGESWRLTPGDVIVFRGDQKHSYYNPGKSSAVGFSVVLLAPLPP